jgi:hypothetical protein
MNLLTLQRRMWKALQQPLTADEMMRPRMKDGKSMRKAAESIIKPNDRLSSFERLEIYNRQYWFRILGSFYEDFPGLRAVLGEKRFEKLAQAYLIEHPSRSFTMRNLCSQLETWLRKNSKYSRPDTKLALDMVRLEWAEIEAFDNAEEPAITKADIENLQPNSIFRLQPYIRLLELDYPVDDILLEIRKTNDFDDSGASNAMTEKKKHAKAKKIRSTKPEKVYLVVHRSNFSIYFKRVDRQSFLALHALQKGLSLSTTINISFTKGKIKQQDPAQLVQKWFQDWASRGWFCRPMPPNVTEISARKE